VYKSGHSDHLMIEGDNLEVLKLLQKSYLGKVKMIYIDPPYNTGKDFVYKDNFGDNLRNYLEYTGQTDDEGRKITSNADTDGRYHSNWLNMMYPRLYLAKNLLRDDGVIFISIDDNYQANSNKLTSITEVTAAPASLKGFVPRGAGYTYDGSGNLKSDTYKGITSITCKYLNLPTSILLGARSLVISC
jgi:DNA modification methylase